ncbi:uncharacterized protein LOC127698790 isoform X2 [Mytilus californianus]|uniref:uncharacterized protein LOC127698790 isoform X2 n=1 Tax=Mytilus californianus TaxID=6549 RepID=UPI002245D171|nr:uncharacterized protein LOC127698790 isoform X2 [Mytilus californianus]
MKSQHPDAIEQTNIELRRSSRNAAGNKLSTSRRRHAKSVSGSGKTISSQNQRTERLHKTVSPIKQKLPIILESPSTCQQQSSVGQPTGEIATPKSSKTYSFTESTPFKEDLLVCSQHFDPQSDVGWDCRSPDAVNFLKRSQRRRHHSDVSDIITQLHVNTEDLHEEIPDSSKTPLLGLWINDGSCFSNNNLPDPQPYRERRKKNKTKSKSIKSKKGNDGAPEALVEKLQHVLEKCEDIEGNEKKDRRKRSLSVGDESKDLFDETSGNVNDIDSWSDDDLFEDDSFIIKATQVQVEPKCQKRKMETRKSDEPPVKLGKYVENQKSIQPSLSTVKPGLSTARLTRVTAKASPFKKHKSFNDRYEYQKSQEKNYNYAVQSKAGRPVDTTACVLTSKQNNTFLSKQFSTVSSKPYSVISTKGSSLYNNAHQVSNVLSKPCKATVQVSNNVCTIKPIVISGCKENVTASTKSYTFYNSKPSFTMAKPGIVNQCPTSTQSYRLSNSDHGVVPSVKSTVSSQCSLTSTQSAYKISTCTSFSTRSSFVTTSKPIPSVASLSNRNIVKTVTSTEIHGKVKDASLTHLKKTACLQSPSSRRTSGAFDTSLSDDILCQLVEPDEILDSQIPVCTGSNKTGHVDDALSFFHDVPQSKSGAGTSVINKQKVPNFKMSASQAKINYDKNHANSSAQISMCSNLKPSEVRRQTNIGANLSNLSSQISKCNSKKFEPKCLNSTKPNQKNNVETSGIEETKNCTLVKQEPKNNQDSIAGNFSKSVNTTSKGLTGAVKVKVETKDESNVIVKKEHRVEPAKSNSFNSRTPRSKTMTVSSASADAMENASEDLFLSDDDELSEPQLLALLEDVESTQSCSSTNARVSLLSNRVNSSVDSHHRIDEKGDKKETTENKQQTFPQAGKDYKISKSKPERQCSDTSPLTCSQEEIKNKKEEALRRLQQKSAKNVQSETSTDDHESSAKHVSKTPTKSVIDKSHLKCSPDDIEKKRLEALRRKQLKLQQGTNTQLDNESQCDASPFKCSPEDIELRKQDAVKRKKLKFDNIDDKKNPERSSGYKITKTIDDKKYTHKTSDINKTSINTNNSKTASIQNFSPVKYSLKDEIEKKKQIALQRRLEKMNSAKNLNHS